MELFVIDIEELAACVRSTEEVSVVACTAFLSQYLAGCSVIFEDIEFSVDDNMFYFWYRLSPCVPLEQPAEEVGRKGAQGEGGEKRQQNSFSPPPSPRIKILWFFLIRKNRRPRRATPST